jgi:hypothetical protein
MALIHNSIILYHSGAKQTKERAPKGKGFHIITQLQLSDQSCEAVWRKVVQPSDFRRLSANVQRTAGDKRQG